MVNQLSKNLLCHLTAKKVEKTATVEVDNGHLVLVIYTPKKRIETAKRHIHWIWNGCIVEQIAAEKQQTAADE